MSSESADYERWAGLDQPTEEEQYEEGMRIEAEIDNELNKESQ